VSFSRKILVRAAAALWGAWLGFCLPCAADEVAIGFSDHLAPYVLPDTQSGIEVEIFRAALAYHDHALKPVFLPTRRLPQAFLNHQVDGLMSDSGVDLSGRGGIYGNSAVGFDNVLVTLKRRRLTIARPEDLSGLKVLAFPGAVARYPRWLEAVERAGRYFESNNQALQVRALQEGQYDVALADRLTYDYFSQSLRSHHVPLDEVEMQEALSPNPIEYPTVFRDQKLRDDFNDGLESLKKSGRYLEIYRRYVKRPS
jgi:polar amino acid transport system substrate-binding protein